jgi:hypothetical protein
MVETAGQQEVFSCEGMSTEQHVLWFLYHAGLSFWRIEPSADVCHIAVHEWYHHLKHLFEFGHDRQQAATVNESNYRWASSIAGSTSDI